MRETWVWSLGWEDPLGKEMAIHSSILASRIPWTEKPGVLWSIGSQRVGHNWATELNWTEDDCVLYVWVCSVSQSCPTLCNPMNRSTPGLPVHHQLLEFIQTHVYRVGEAIQPSHPLSSPSPPAFNLSQHQGLLKWVSSSHEVAKVLEFQLQHHSFQWTPRTDLL